MRILSEAKRLAAIGLVLLLMMNTGYAEKEPELARVMGTLQYFLHKTMLAVDNENRPLAVFYAHELEETIEELTDIKEYAGYPIGALVDSMLEPPFADFETALDEDEWGQTSEKLDGLIGACNGCHLGTEHGFIVIERSSGHSFPQRFSPAGN